MNTYNEKEIIALLQDPARQKKPSNVLSTNTANSYIGRYAGWYFLMKMPMICYRIHLSKHGLI